jgi:hypothetical protein
LIDTVNRILGRFESLSFSCHFYGLSLKVNAVIFYEHRWVKGFLLGSYDFKNAVVTINDKVVNGKIKDLLLRQNSIILKR